MPRYNTEPFIEFSGVESYPEAMEMLLNNRKEIGGVAIRGCFDPATVDRTEYRIRRSTILPDKDVMEAGDNVVKAWWRDNGYLETRVITPNHDSRWSKAGFKGDSIESSIKDHGTIVTGISSISGTQNVYTLPLFNQVDEITGERDADVVEANNQSFKEIKMELRRAATSEAAHRRLLKQQVELQPGDMALVMGEPTPSYVALRAQQGKSNYTMSSHRYEKGRAFIPFKL